METNLTQVKVQNKVTTQSKIKTRIQIFLAQILFPTAHRDWYKIKGYGKNGKNPFEDFLEQQLTNPKAKYYKEFKGLR